MYSTRTVKGGMYYAGHAGVGKDCTNCCGGCGGARSGACPFTGGPCTAQSYGMGGIFSDIWNGITTGVNDLTSWLTQHNFTSGGTGQLPPGTGTMPAGPNMQNVMLWGGVAVLAIVLLKKK